MIVEQIALRGGLEQQLMRVLTVNMHQTLAQLAQLRQCHRHTVDERATFALRVDGTANQHDVGLIGIELLFVQPCGNLITDLKFCRDIGFIGTLRDQARIGALTQQQANRVKQNRFTSAGLTREHGKTRLDVQIEGLHNHKVAQTETNQHDVE